MIHVICFEGTSSSSCGPCDVTSVVDTVVAKSLAARSKETHTLRIASTRKLREQFDAIVRKALTFDTSDPEIVCIGKSLGAIRMFRVLNSGGRARYVTKVISIDPVSMPRMLFGHPVRAGIVMGRTTNIYQRRCFPRGSIVVPDLYHTNVRIISVPSSCGERSVSVNHQNIIRSIDVQWAIENAVKYHV